MKKSFAAAATVAAALALVSLGAGSASATPSQIGNGGFEVDANGATTVTNWNTLNQRIDLGVDSIAGCLTQDTSDYTTLGDYATYARSHNALLTNGSDAVLDPNGATFTVNSQTVLLISGSFAYRDALNGNVVTPFSGSDLTYITSTVVPAAALAVANDGATGITGSFNSSVSSAEHSSGANSLKLTSSNLSGQVGGYIAHGPAAYSDVFTASTGRAITFDWKAAAGGDDYHVFGYLLNVDTCAQTEVVDSTGTTSPWTNVTVPIPSAGNYRFVFVSGSYDRSWGGAAGASLYIDNIVQVADFSGGIGLDLSLDLAVGDSINNAPADLSGGGLGANSAFTLTLHSTPQVLFSGFADSSGNFYQPVTLPASVEAGSHSLILTGTAPDGSTVSKTVWFTVDAAGTVTYFSATTPPAAATVTAFTLPDTGFNAGPWALTGAVVLLLGGALFFFGRRRAKSQA